MPYTRTASPLRAIPRALFLFTLLAIASSGGCKVVYVNKNSTGAVHDGASWATACVTVQAGVNAAVANDEVWVAKGTYYDTVSLPAGVSLYGGFAGSEPSLSQRDWMGNATILDGNSASNPVVRSYAGGTTIDGLTIRNADAGIDVGGSATISNCNVSGKAYGIYVYQCAVSVSNCDISNSPVGLYATGASTIVTGCVISGSSTYGIQIDGGSATLSKSTVTANGKGVYVDGGTAAIDACKIADNLAEGVYIIGNTTLINCAITGNSTRGVLVDGGVTATITNCTLSGNNTIGVCVFRGSAPTTNSIVAFNGTGFLRLDPSGSEALSHNDVFGNSSGNYSGLPDPGAANGNISADPLFNNPPAGDFHLLTGSPCINAGDDTAVTPGETDLDGKPRIAGSQVDIGAYEYIGTAVPYSVAEAAAALKIAGGLISVPNTDFARLNVESSGASALVVDMYDAIHIARKVAGLETNP